MKKAIVLSAAAMFLVSFAAAQTMSTPVNVSHSIGYSRWGQVAMTADGVVHIVWLESPNLIQYVKYDGTNFSAPLKLKSSTSIPADRPYITATRDGRLLVVWDEDDACILKEYDPQTQAWRPAYQVAESSYDTETPCVTGDGLGNIFVGFNCEFAGQVFARCRINGVWEEPLRLPNPSVRSKAVTIASAGDGWVWLVFGEKQSSGSYKARYTKRTIATDWIPTKFVNPNVGADQDRPNLVIDPNDRPWLAFGNVDEVAKSFVQEIYVIELNEAGNPAQKILPYRLQHYAKMAIDARGKKHIAVQVGPGESGTGVIYTNNLSGHWTAPYQFPDSAGHPKIPGIATDGRNVAVVWDSLVGDSKDIWLSTLYPVTLLYPPKDLTTSYAISGGTAPQITYSFGWAADPRNNAAQIAGYRLYRRGSGAASYTRIQELNAQRISTTYDETTFDLNVAFGITAVTTSGAESAVAAFTLNLSDLKPPVSPTVRMLYDHLKTTPQVTYKFSWQNDPSNAANLVKSFKIYQTKPGKATWELLATVDGTVTAYDLTRPAGVQKEFGVSAVSVFGTETAVVPIVY